MSYCAKTSQFAMAKTLFRHALHEFPRHKHAWAKKAAYAFFIPALLFASFWFLIGIGSLLIMASHGTKTPSQMMSFEWIYTSPSNVYQQQASSCETRPSITNQGIRTPLCHTTQRGEKIVIAQKNEFMPCHGNACLAGPTTLIGDVYKIPFTPAPGTSPRPAPLGQWNWGAFAALATGQLAQDTDMQGYEAAFDSFYIGQDGKRLSTFSGQTVLISSVLAFLFIFIFQMSVICSLIFIAYSYLALLFKKAFKAITHGTLSLAGMSSIDELSSKTQSETLAGELDASICRPLPLKGKTRL